MCAVCPSWLSFVLYNPIRKILTNREKVFDDSGITADSVVLEIGSGNGFFTEKIAERARKVYAVELQEGMVRKLRKRVRGFGSRVEIISGDIACCRLEQNSVDACLMYYSFHEVRHRKEASVNISNAIKPGGVLAVYEPRLEVGKAKMQDTVRLFESAGFEKEKERDGLFTRFARLRKYY